MFFVSFESLNIKNNFNSIKILDLWRQSPCSTDDPHLSHFCRFILVFSGFYTFIQFQSSYTYLISYLSSIYRLFIYINQIFPSIVFQSCQSVTRHNIVTYYTIEFHLDIFLTPLSYQAMHKTVLCSLVVLLLVCLSASYTQAAYFYLADNEPSCFVEDGM